MMNLKTRSGNEARCRAVLLLAIATLGILTVGKRTAEAAPKRWVPDGFKLETFAQPPDATYPTGMAVSPNGVAYVSVDLNSSLDRKPNRGKIIRCVDTDGDGIADRYTDFVPDIDSPRGSCFVGDTLYVIHPPHFTAFRDTNNDGVADENVELIKGLGFDLSFRGADHTSNGARMGIDGWLYLAIGDYGFTNAVALDGSALHLRGGGVLRVRPNGSELEYYSLYTRNICDVAVSPTLDVLARDNTNDGKGWDTRLHHFISLADHGYPRLYKNFTGEHLQPLADYGSGSGTGAYYLDEPGFPKHFNDTLYTCDFTTKHVYLHPLERTEATFRAGQEPFFAIQAIDIDVDGFSRIYVNDWEGGGYTYKNPAVGSISRITFPGLEPARFPDLNGATDAELLPYLVSNSAVCRINTQREILKRGQNQTFLQGLKSLASDRDGALNGRIAALFTLKQLYGVESHPVLVSLCRDAVVREYALRALADRKSELTGVPVGPFVEGLSDSDPRVRLQSIIGLARLGREDQASRILPLLVEASSNPEPGLGKYDNNQAIQHIARKALAELNASAVCLEALSNERLRKQALMCLQEMHTPAAVNGLIARLVDSLNEELKSGILRALFRLYHADKRWDGKQWWSTRPDDRGPYFEPVLWSESDRIRNAIEENFARVPAEQQAELMIDMRRNRMDPGSFHLNAEVDEIQAMIAATNPGNIAVDPLKNAAVSNGRSVETRKSAFYALGRINGAESFQAQVEVLDSWNRSDPDESAFTRIIRDFVYAPEHAGDARILQGLSNRARGFQRQLLLKIYLHLADSPLSSENVQELAKNVIGRNRNRVEFIRAVGEMGLSQYRDDVLRAAESDQHETAVAGKESLAKLDVLDLQRAAGGSKRIADMSYAEAMAALRTAPGNAPLGAALFSKQGCVACHTTSPDQPLKGPYLGDAGSKWKREDLLVSMLKPSEVVAQGFQTQWFEMKDESIFEGFVTGEKDGQIELRNVSGIAFQISANEIVRRGMRATSIMPEGLASNLSLHEMASLIAYLESLK